MRPTEFSRQSDRPKAGAAPHQRVVLIASLIALAVGGGFMLLGFLISHSADWLSHLLIEIGKVIVVTSVVGVIFEFVMHERFVQRVKEQVGSIEEQVHRLDNSIDALQKTVAITAGAIESGLSAVYSERQKALEQISNLLVEAGEGQELRLLGISLGDFLCPHGHLYHTMVRALEKGMKVKALIVDLNSEAARTRAQREENTDETPVFGTAEWANWYHSTRCYNELKTATDAARVFARNFAGVNGNGTFEFQTYALSPLCFLAMYDETMFLESYHYAGRGGEAPILQIAKKTSAPGDSHLFAIYRRHFDVLWSLPRIEIPQEPRLILRDETQGSSSEPATPGNA